MWFCGLYRLTKSDIQAVGVRYFSNLKKQLWVNSMVVCGLYLFCLHSTKLLTSHGCICHHSLLDSLGSALTHASPGARSKWSHKVCLVFGSHSGSPWKLNFPTLTPEQNSKHSFWLHEMEVRMLALSNLKKRHVILKRSPWPCFLLSFRLYVS